MVPNLGDMETHSHSYTFAHNMKLELQFVYLIQNTSEIRETIFFFILNLDLYFKSVRIDLTFYLL
jgi:hypothetical protein